MKNILFSLTLSFLATAHAQVIYVTNQHVDITLEYNPEAEGSNRLDISFGYEESGRSYNTNTYVSASADARTSVPSNPNYSFLGTPGSAVWVLPQTQNTALPVLGLSGEDITAGIFDAPMQMQLVAVEGPGGFFMWYVPGVGQPPAVEMIATNGSPVAGFAHALINPGDHSHHNWGFKTNGLYVLTFRNNGRFAGDASYSIGKDVPISFQILPLRPWETWVSTNWLPGTRLATNGPSADPDSDGVPNAMEYALGMDPHIASRDGLPEFTFVSESGQNYGALVFNKCKMASDITYLPYVRSDISSGDWTLLTNTFSVVDEGDSERVVIRDFVPAHSELQRYYQLRIQLAYP